jgi:biotin carboxylase
VTTILILGAGVMQEPAIRIARRKGWRVILVDGNPRAIARDRADLFECIDLKDKEGLFAFASAIREKSGLDGVFTAGTDFSSSVAWVAERLGLPGIPYATAMRATDKCLMRQAFAAAGVPSPVFVCWPGTGDPAAALPPDMKFPFVVKPVDNMGARGVKRVENAEELVEACRTALPLSRSLRVIIEQFMEGPEFSLDAIVYRGNITVCGVADRLIRFPPSFVEMGHTMPTGFDREAVQAVESIFRAGIKAIGIDNGAAKGDVKLTPAGPMVGEIAARLSGGYMSGWTYPLASGIEVTEAALNVAVGQPPGRLTPSRSRVCAERALISIPGIVEEVAGEDVVRAAEGVAELFLRIAPGNAVVFPSNNVEKCGNVLTIADSLDGAEASARRALALFQIRLRPLVQTTTDFLSKQRVHDCFSDLPAGILSEIQGFPGSLGDPAGIDPAEPVAIETAPGWEHLGQRDWHGTGFAESVRLACERGRGFIRAPGKSEGFRLCGLFWRALVRGGHQGAVYVLDSVRESARRGTLKEFLARP